MKAYLETVAGNPENQDSGAIINCATASVLVVADGAGGRSGAREAATMAVEMVRLGAGELHDAISCVRLLQTLDQSICQAANAGETTCALAVITETEVFGASVGDSGVWLINANAFRNLTERQSRKPFIGSGSAVPVGFECIRGQGESLLLATDGLLKYTSSDRILETCRNSNASEVSRRLIELVRYPSGALPDNVTVIFTSLDS